MPELLEQYRSSQQQDAAAAARKVHERHALPRLPRRSGSIRRPAPSRVDDSEHAAVRRAAGAVAAARSAACRFPTRPSSSASSSSTPRGNTIAAEVLKEIRGRLGFLTNVGLDYLTLDRTAPTLSGGESQRIRLAGQIGCGLVGVLYILDEPSIGLHPRDNDRLLATLTQLARPGQHGRRRRARRRHDAGGRPHRRLRPRARRARRRSRRHRHGRRRSPQSQRSLTGQYLSGKRKIEIPADAPPAGRASGCGSSARRTTTSRTSTSRFRSARSSASPACRGSGKSSLVNDILVEALRRDLNGGEGEPGDARADRRARASRQADRHRPVADRPHAALEPGDVHQAVRRHPRPVHAAARVEGPRLQAGPVQLQRRRRPLRSLRRERLEPAGDGFSGRRLGHLPGLRGASLQPRDAAGPVQGQEHRRRAGDGRAAGARALREHPQRFATSCRRCTTSGSTT